MTVKHSHTHTVPEDERVGAHGSRALAALRAGKSRQTVYPWCTGRLLRGQEADWLRAVLQEEITSKVSWITGKRIICKSAKIISLTVNDKAFRLSWILLIAFRTCVIIKHSDTVLYCDHTTETWEMLIQKSYLTVVNRIHQKYVQALQYEES